MKNIKYLFLILAFGTFFANAAFAQESAQQIVKNQEVTLKDLGVSNPGILPGNPFYFLKEWGRGVKNTFTFSPVKKAELQLNAVNEKAAEIKKLKELLPSTAKNLVAALDNYQKNIEILKDRVDSIGNASGAEADNFLNQLSDNIIKHIKLFSELKEGQGDKVKNKLAELQEKATELMAEIPLKMETPNEFKCRLEKVIKSQEDGALKEITVSDVLDRLDEKATQETRIELLKLKENLLIRFQSRLESEDFSEALTDILNQLPGDSVRKIKILDEIREGVSNSDAKNKLNLARQDILDKAAESKAIRKPEAEKMIEEAAGLVAGLQGTMGATSTPKSVIITGLFNKAKFNLEQARQALDLNNYGQAFGQASASAAASNTALNYISKFNSSSGMCAEDDVQNLREYHDEIIARMKEMDLTGVSSSTIKTLLEKSEKSIAKISDLVKKNTKADTLIPLIKDAKLMLSQLDNKLADIFQDKK